MRKQFRAAQIWPLLAYCAKQRTTLSYDLLSRLIGVPRAGLGQLLEPIQSFCILNDLPPLTSLVVSAITGLPGEGFIAAADVPRAQAEVYRAAWLEASTPTPEELQKAVKILPSVGRSLEELLATKARLTE